MYEFKHILTLILLLFSFALKAQVSIFSPEANGTASTNYQGFSKQDAIYVFCNELPQLTAKVDSAGADLLYTFAWSKFNESTNSFEPFASSNHPSQSTISNLPDGGYSIQVFNQFGQIVGCDRAWVYANYPEVTISKLPEICSSFTLNANLNHQETFTYFNPPSNPLIISENTQITVCFSAQHDYISDLGFYLVGPEECGSPKIKLMEPFAITTGNDHCNDGNDVKNLCFSTSSQDTISDYCNFPAPLSGTFTSAEPWSVLYGCRADYSGWKVMVYDCIDGDVGILTHASISFSDSSGSCRPNLVDYDSGEISNVINDNSCSAQNATTYVVPSIAAKPRTLSNPSTYRWTENAPFFELDNQGIGKSIFVNRPPKSQTTFVIKTEDNFGCMDSNSVDYAFQPNAIPVITPVNFVCHNYEPFNLHANTLNGLWAGEGVIDQTTGLFDPSIVDGDTARVFYTDTSKCGGVGSSKILIKHTPESGIFDKSPVCDYDSDGSLSLATEDNGNWSYEWLNNNWETLFIGDKTTPTFANIPIGHYFAIMSFSNGCIDTLAIDFMSKQEADVSLTPSVNETSVEVPFVTFSANSKSILNEYFFEMNDLTLAEGVFSYTHEFQKIPGSYDIYFIGKDQLNCYDTAKATIELTYEFEVYIPNAFTPNNDGINDELKLFATDMNLLSYELEVVNTLGQQVHYSRNIREVWDGKHNGRLVPSGKYFYRVVAESKTTGKPKEYTGFIFILH